MTVGAGGRGERHAGSGPLASGIPAAPRGSPGARISSPVASTATLGRRWTSNSATPAPAMSAIAAAPIGVPGSGKDGTVGQVAALRRGSSRRPATRSWTRTAAGSGPGRVATARAGAIVGVERRRRLDRDDRIRAVGRRGARRDADRTSAGGRWRRVATPARTSPTTDETRRGVLRGGRGVRRDDRVAVHRRVRPRRERRPRGHDLASDPARAHRPWRPARWRWVRRARQHAVACASSTLSSASGGRASVVTGRSPRRLSRIRTASATAPPHDDAGQPAVLHDREPVEARPGQPIERGLERRLRLDGRQRRRRPPSRPRRAPSPSGPGRTRRSCRAPMTPSSSVPRTTGNAAAADPPRTWSANVSIVRPGGDASSTSRSITSRTSTPSRTSSSVGAPLDAPRGRDDEPATEGDHQPVDRIEER